MIKELGRIFLEVNKPIMAFESKMNMDKFSDFWKGLDTFFQITDKLELEVCHACIYSI